MFSGIIESVQPIVFAKAEPGLVRIQVQRPPEFDDIKLGDSIAVDGVCLTVESFEPQTLQFALAAETLKVLCWPQDSGLLSKKVNLERSLRYGDRIHGHLVSGHVDSLGVLKSRKTEGGSLFLDVEFDDSPLPFVWQKGSVTLNGVSLTVNRIVGRVLQVCLIPETLKRTNLGLLQVGQNLNVEPDWMAKGLTLALENQLREKSRQRETS